MHPLPLPLAATAGGRAPAATAGGVTPGHSCYCRWHLDSNHRSDEVLRVGPYMWLELLADHGHTGVEALAALICSVCDARLALIQLVVLTVPVAGSEGMQNS